MRKIFQRYVVVGLLVFLADTALANDGAANLGVGGLEFTTSEFVVMEKEDLYLSPQLVKVDYVFRNISENPVELQVAFPLPVLDTAKLFDCFANTQIPFPNSPNFVGFRTFVNSNPVSAEIETKAEINGRDVSALLRTLQIPYNLPGNALSNALKQLPAQKRSELIAAGLLQLNKTCIGELQPLWFSRTTYHWKQRFEPGLAVRISHTYQPSMGGFFIQPDSQVYGSPDRLTVKEINLNPFCIDAGTWRAIQKMAPGGAAYNQRIVVAHNLQYILRTARSWSGPIRKFSLTIDKRKPEAIVSTCGDGLRKIGPALFQMRKINVRPDDDLNILFVERM